MYNADSFVFWVPPFQWDIEVLMFSIMSLRVLMLDTFFPS